MKAKKILDQRKNNESWSKYQTNPIGFCKEALGDTFTEDVQIMIQSVVDNTITIARSANGVGKSYSAARIAVFFLKCFPDSQIWLTAAPPERNLRDILWAHVLDIKQRKPAMFSEFADRRMKIQRQFNTLSFLEGVSIPMQGTSAEREGKFCADVDDIFEMYDGTLARYGDLVGRKDVPVVSVNENFDRKWSQAEFFDNGTQLVYEIKFEDGEVVRRTGNHPLYAGWDIRPDFRNYSSPTHAHGRIRACKEGWLEVSDLREGYAVLCPDSTEFNLGSNKVDEDILKFLGYMIGDGSFGEDGRLQFTQDDNEQLTEFLQILDEFGASYTVSHQKDHNWSCVNIKSGLLSKFVEECGLSGKKSGDKFVPDFVYGQCKEQLAVFLNRLFSTDGWACLTKAGDYRKAEIGYASKSQQLIYGVQRLLKRFGIHARVISKVVSWTSNDQEDHSGIYWTLYISRAIDIIRFAENIGIYGKEQALAECLEYSEDRLWTYANWTLEKPDYRWKRIRSIRVIGKRPTVGVHVPGDNTYLTSLVEHNSGKHAAHLIFIVDEGDAVPEEVYRGIESCMTSEYVRLLILFNPRAPSGIIYEMEKKGLANVVELSAFRHPNVITGKDVIPGAVSRGVTVRRINEWTRQISEDEDKVAAAKEADNNPDETLFTVPDFLVGATAVSTSGGSFPPLPIGRRKITEDGFYYMVMGKYPGIGSKQLIADAWIDAAVDRRKNYVALYGEVPPKDIKPVLGVDVAEFGGDNNCCVIRYSGYVSPLRLWAGLDPDQSADKLVGIYTEVGAETSKIDGMGVGSGVAPRMVRVGRDRGLDVSAWSVKVNEKPSKMTHTELGEFYSMRDEIAWRCREWLRLDPTAMLPDDPMLKEELKAMEYDYFGGGKIKIVEKKILRERLKRSPDRADALFMSFAPFERATVVSVEEQQEIADSAQKTGSAELDEWRKRQDEALMEMANRM